MLFGKNRIKEKMNYDTAKEIADAMNRWAGNDFYKEIITPEEVQKLPTIPVAKDGGYTMYALQWGDVTIVVRPDTGTCKHLCW